MASVDERVTEELKTTVKFEEFRSKWEARAADPTQLKSAVLKIGGWGLCVHVQDSPNKGGKIAISLDRCSDNKRLLHVERCWMKCVHERSWEQVVFVPEWFNGCNGSWYPGLTTTWGWRWIAWGTAQELLSHADASEGTLSIEVVLSVAKGYQDEDPPSCLKMPLAEMSQAFSSKIITIKGDADCEVNVPEGVLCAHSAFFAAALHTDMEEARTGIIKAPDAQKQALEDLRDCLYSGGLPSSLVAHWARLSDLLVLANKYAITPLVHACSFYLCMMLTPKSAPKLLANSYKYDLAHLRKAAVYFTMFTTTNFDAVVASDEYDTFSADLLRDLYAHAETLKKQDEPNKKTIPSLAQWADVPYEFADGTDWQNLSKQSLRRACFERLLGTNGTAAELLVRLANPGTQVDQVEVAQPAAKRQRTD